MPWEERTVEKLREAFVKAVLNDEMSMSAACRAYEISRTVGYKWLERYKAGEDLGDRSRAPFHTPLRTDAEMERNILLLRDEHPAWGARKIKRRMEDGGIKDVPAASTICAILKRNGRVSEEASRASTPYKRFEMEAANDLWQVDFKGHFALGDGTRCHPLTLLDDHSRFALCVEAKENERLEGVVDSFERVFEENGLPKSILSDNGNPWGASQSTGYTQFDLWLMSLDILPIHGRPYHPQTQGKNERFNRTLDVEAIRGEIIEDMIQAQERFDRFVWVYNYERPHEALKLEVPASRYEPSKRRLPERIEGWEYTREQEARKIKGTGYLTYKGQGYFLGEAFGGKTVGIGESTKDGCVNIYYRNFQVAQLSVTEKCIVSRKIYRQNETE